MRDQATVAAMLCPVCKVGLSMSDRAGVEIDYCPQCRGVWLDRGELDKIIERSAADGMVAEPPAFPGQPAAPPPQQQQPWGQPQHSSHRNDGYRDDGYRDHGYGHDPRYGRKRKKSFLEDLFD